jgi:hypothetical protein
MTLDVGPILKHHARLKKGGSSSFECWRLASSLRGAKAPAKPGQIQQAKPCISSELKSQYWMRLTDCWRALVHRKPPVSLTPYALGTGTGGDAEMQKTGARFLGPAPVA